MSTVMPSAYQATPSDTDVPVADSVQYQLPVVNGLTDGFSYVGPVGGVVTAEQFHPMDDNDPLGDWGKGDWNPNGIGVPVDQEIGGVNGWTDNNVFSIGAVVPGHDSYEMRGETLRVRRKAESSPGPVGGMDYASQLQLAMAQEIVSTAFDNAAQAQIAGAI